MKLYVVAVVCYRGKDICSSAFAVVRETLGEALRDCLYSTRFTNPESEGWRDHTADGFEVERRLLDEVKKGK